MERICNNGHTYHKTSACPVCPICEKMRIPEADFLSLFAAPARRALESHGITSLEKLKQTPEKMLLSFHGFGPSSIKVVRDLLN